MKPVLVVGGGGHASVLVDALALCNVPIAGIVAPQAPVSSALKHIPWLGGDERLSAYRPDDILLINALGSVANTERRSELYLRRQMEGFSFFNVIHPTAIRSAFASQIGAGLQLLAGAIVGPNIKIGENVLINSGAIVEHDCVVGDHTHIASGAVVCGGCTLGTNVHVGAGSVIKQGVAVGNGACVAAGAVVIHDVPPATLVAGVPAVFKKRL